MKEIFNKPVLDQLYTFRKEEFEQNLYNEDEQIKKLELEITDLSEGFVNYLKAIITDENELKKVLKLFRNYELKASEETDCWTLIYFKLGIVEGNKLAHEITPVKTIKKDDDSFLNYNNNNFSEWLEEQKRKYCFDTPEYKELQDRYRKISEKYPNATEVFEDLEFIELNKEEQKALIELRKIDVEMGDMEKDLCFKLGIKEVMSFYNGN